MEPTVYLRTIVVLLLVIALLVAVLWGLRYLMRHSSRWARLGLGATRSRRDRLAIVESLVVDGRSRLVLVQRDETEHLLLLGPEGGLVVESAIKSAAKSDLSGDGETTAP